MPNLTLNDIVDITVSVTPTIRYRKNFDCALVLGDSVVDASPVISAATRVKEYTAKTALATMIVDGFTVNSPEYLAVSTYLSQSTAPNRIFVGCKVSAESLVEALTACRTANSDWYIAILAQDLVSDATNVELNAVASYVETASPETMLAINVFEASYSEAETTIEALKAGNYSRTFVQFDSNADNANKCAIAAICGYMMGYTKKLSPSFSASFKTLNGINTADISEVDLTSLLGNNANVYINQGYYYNIFRQGKSLNGNYLDEMIYLDMLVNDISSSIMEKLLSVPKIPQTDDGLNMLSNAMVEALDKYKSIGFIQPGVWEGDTILSLNTGDSLSGGYMIQFESLATQSAADRAARVAPNCYIAVKLAGAIEKVIISVNINR